MLVALDAVLQLTQGVGLAYRRRWAAWLTVVTTSTLIPVEVYQFAVHPRWSPVVILAGNLAIVGYLVFKVRRSAATWRGAGPPAAERSEERRVGKECRL